MAVFSLIDWVIVILSLVLTVVAGYAVRKYIGKLSDYLVAERGMGLWVGTASLVSTEIGIITYVYFAELGYVAGFGAFAIALISGIVAYCVGKTGFVIKHLRELEIMTIPEYFQARYTRGVRILAGCLMAFGGALNLGIFPKLEASFLNIVLGIRMEHLPATMAVLLTVVLVYTAAGGMVSLIVTNYIQYVLLSVGTVVVTVVVLYSVGLSKIVNAVQTHMGTSGFNPFANHEFGTAFIIWQVLLWLAVMTTWQSVAMRSFSSTDAATGKKMFSLTSVLFVARGVLPIFWGIAALAFLGSQLNHKDAMAHLLATILPHGLLGLMVAGMLAASLSTYSGYLLAWSSIISQDIVTPLIRRELSEKGKLLLTRITVIGLTVFIMVWGLIYKVPGPAYFYLNITGNLFLAGAFFAIAGGIYWKRSSTMGAYLAFILGAVGACTFFFHSSATAAGVYSFALAFLGQWLGSVLKPNSPLTASKGGAGS
jgi:solute:Na+ symporter, SSS family